MKWSSHDRKLAWLAGIITVAFVFAVWPRRQESRPQPPPSVAAPAPVTPWSVQLQRAYQKSPTSIQLEGKASGEPAQRATVVFGLRNGQGQIISKKETIVATGFFQVQFVADKPFSGELFIEAAELKNPHPVEMLADQSTARMQSDKAEPEKTDRQTLVARMPDLALLLDNSARKLCEADHTPSSAFGDFYRVWHQERKRLHELTNDGDPLATQRLKTFYEALKQTADMVIAQYDAVPPAAKKYFLNQIADAQLQQLAAAVRKSDEIVDEFHPQLKNDKALPYLSTWLTNLELVRFRAHCLLMVANYRKQGKLAQALHECDKVLQALPNDWTVLLQRCALYWDMGKEDLARQDWQAAQKIAAKSQAKLFADGARKFEMELSVRAGDCQKKGQYAEALSLLRFAQLVNPGNKEIVARIQEVKNLKK